MAASLRALSLLEEKTPNFPKNLVTLSNPQGKIIIQNLFFSYNNTSPTLEDIDLIIKPGETVAFVGSTGSGKSTLIKLILGFYPPRSSHVLIDDIEVTSIDPKNLHDVISIVSQEVYLFHGTVAQNISYGLDFIDLERVIQAAKLAHIHEDIMAMPLRYETHLFERGQNLSDGQKQRLAFARAILRNPKILILDEATSAMDNDTEYNIQKAMDLIVQNRTVIIIAHRLSTVRKANKIFVLDHGKIVEQGTHKTLLEERGMYESLWKLQIGER